MMRDNPPLPTIRGVATIYPVDIRNALVDAGQKHDLVMIDMLTDSLARQGLCRARKSDEIQPAHVAAAKGLG